MDELPQLTGDNAPLLAKAYLFNGAIIGVTPEGELRIVARLLATEKPKAPRTRAPRKRKETTQESS